MVRRSVRNRFIGASALSLALIGASATAGEAGAGGVCAVESWITDAAHWVEGMPDRVTGAYSRTLERARERLHGTLGVRLMVQGGAEGPALWVRPGEAGEVPSRLVLLVHGLDDPGSIWDEVAPALRSEGHSVARFDYANDQPIAASADELASALADLRAQGVERVDIVAHSMGGLVARDVLTRCEHYAGDTAGNDRLPRVDRMVTFGTPNAGAPLAHLRGVMEIRDQWERLATSDSFDAADLLGFIVDGGGEAGEDLLPGSAFLTELNSRPPPRPVEILTVEGRALPVGPADVRPVLEGVVARAVLGESGTRWVQGVVDAAASALGDGAVPADSVPLDGGSTPVALDADHRSMLRRVPAMSAIRGLFGEPDGPPPGVALLIEFLAPGTGILPEGP